MVKIYAALLVFVALSVFQVESSDIYRRLWDDLDHDEPSRLLTDPIEELNKRESCHDQDAFFCQMWTGKESSASEYCRNRYKFATYSNFQRFKTVVCRKTCGLC